MNRKIRWQDKNIENLEGITCQDERKIGSDIYAFRSHKSNPRDKTYTDNIDGYARYAGFNAVLINHGLGDGFSIKNIKTDKSRRFRIVGSAEDNICTYNEDFMAIEDEGDVHFRHNQTGTYFSIRADSAPEMIDEGIWRNGDKQIVYDNGIFRQMDTDDSSESKFKSIHERNQTDKDKIPMNDMRNAYSFEKLVDSVVERDDLFIESRDLAKRWLREGEEVFDDETPVIDMRSMDKLRRERREMSKKCDDVNEPMATKGTQEESREESNKKEEKESSENDDSILYDWY